MTSPDLVAARPGAPDPAGPPDPGPPVDVPARIVLAPHRRLLSRGPRERQFGLDPDGSVTVADLPSALLALLERLSAPAAALEWIAEAAERGVPSWYSGPLLTGLVARGVLVDAAAAERRVSRRSASSVLVKGAGPLAVGVAAALARAGVGGVRVEAPGHVGSVEVGPGIGIGDVGRPRSAVAAEAVARVGGGPGPARAPDLVVLADAVTPADVGELAVAGTDHLAVVVREGIGVVGPLVLLGRSACLRCVELARAARDPAWPVVAAQISGQPGSAEPAAVAATAALGAAQALLALDGPTGAGPPPTLGASLELDVHAGALHRRQWAASPECPCGAERGPSNAVCVPAPRRETIMG